MSHTEHHLEHATHGHGHGDGFEKKVAMTIAIVAAVLAGTTTLSHRGHTEVLRLQGDSNRLETEANVLTTQESDAWAYYQAKNIRKHYYRSMLEAGTTSVAAPSPLPEWLDDKDRKEKWGRDRWVDQLRKYKDEIPDHMKDAKELHAKAEEKRGEGKDLQKESHVMEEKVNRYDAGELGIELAMVLCSVSVLTRQRGFWLLGILSAVIGVAVVVSGMMGFMISH